MVNEKYNIILETKRLILREMVDSDFESLKKIISDKENMKYYPKPYDDSGVTRWLSWCIDSYKKNGFGLWAVVLKETGEMIGDCGVSIQMIDGAMCYEIGYHLRLDYHGLRLASEASQAVKDYFFQNFSYDEVYSYMNIENIPSIKTAEANGMKRVGSFVSKDGEVDLIYKITRSEWIKG